MRCLPDGDAFGPENEMGIHLLRKESLLTQKDLCHGVERPNARAGHRVVEDDVATRFVIRLAGRQQVLDRLVNVAVDMNQSHRWHRCQDRGECPVENAGNRHKIVLQPFGTNKLLEATQVSIIEIARAVQVALGVRLRQALEGVESIDLRAPTQCPQNAGNEGRRATTVAAEFENVAAQGRPPVFHDQKDVSELLRRHDRSAARGVAQSLSVKRVLPHSLLVDLAELEAPSAPVAGTQVAPMMDANRITAWIKHTT